MRGDVPVNNESDASGVTLANWQDAPFNRWAFLHLDELLKMAPISRGEGPVTELTRDERDVDGVTFEVHGQRWRLDEMLDATFTDGFVALHEGRIVTERYAEGMSSETLHLTMSVSKSLTSALVGVLMGQGRLDPTGLVTSFVPELEGTSFDGCTVQHLLDMRAGTRWSEDYENYSESDAWVMEEVIGWRPRTRSGLAPDLFTYIANLTENTRPHGGPFEYRSVLIDLLGWVLERAGGKPFAELFSREVWSKLGAERDAEITIDEGGCALTDGGISTTLRDLARFGQLYLDDGCGIVTADWCQRPTSAAPELVEAFSKTPEAALYPGAMYHDLWWALLPQRGVIVGLGIYGQMLLIDRSTGGIVAKFSTQRKAVDIETDYLQIMGALALCEALAAGQV
jgi:CubicO group peptidase (beta-lactamase class C family)